MKCPVCQTLNPENSNECGNCHTSFHFFTEMEKLQGGIEELKYSGEKLVQKAGSLENQLQSIRQMLVPPKPGEQPVDREMEDITQTSPKRFIPSLKPTWYRWLQDRGEVELGQKALLIVGLLTLVFGVAYYLRFAMEREWIGPVARVTLSYVGGMGLLGGGEFARRRKLEVFGLFLVGGGIAVFYLGTFAAFNLYNLIGQLPAFALMIAITVVGVVLSVVYNNQGLSFVSVTGGFLTPVLLSTGVDLQLELMIYMTLLNAGILAVSFYKQWVRINVTGFLFTWILFITWYIRHFDSSKAFATILFLNVFYLLYSIIPFAGYLSEKGPARRMNLGIVFPNAFIAFVIAFAILSELNAENIWVSLFCLIYAAFFLGMAYVLHKNGKINAMVPVVAEAAMFLVLAVPFAFFRHWITIFWLIESIALLWVGLKLYRPALFTGFIVLYTVSFVKLLMFDLSGNFHLNWNTISFSPGYFHLFWERAMTYVISLSVIWIAATLLRKKSGIERTNDFLQQNNWPVIFYSMFGGVLFLFLNLETGAFFHSYAPQARFAMISVLWALFALGLMALGFIQNHRGMRKISIILFGLTLIKVFLMDLKNADTPFRIISFLILGAVLVGTSFLYHRYKDRILNLVEKSEDGVED